MEIVRNAEEKIIVVQSVLRLKGEVAENLIMLFNHYLFNPWLGLWINRKEKENFMTNLSEEVKASGTVEGITATINAGEPFSEYQNQELTKRFEELHEASLPLLNFLNKYYNPHTYAMVTEGRVEILMGVMATPLPVRD